MEQRSQTDFFQVEQGNDYWTKPRLYKFSEYIHRDRHLFLGKAMFEGYIMDQSSEFPSPTPRMPGLKKVQLSLDVFNDQPKFRFSEPLNTYVDTRKRIRIVNSVDDYERRANTLTLPSISHKNLLGILKTIPLRKPCAGAQETGSEGNGSGRPPFQKEETFYPRTEFQTESESDRSHDMLPRMPLRFRCAMKPLPLWRQKTDSLVMNQRSGKLRFRNG